MPIPPADAAVSDNVNGNIVDRTATPIAGARVCVLHRADIPCSTTDASGNYTMTLPDLQGVDIAVSVTAPGFLGYVTTLRQPTDTSGVHAVLWRNGIPLRSNAEAMQRFATEAGFTFPGAGTGFLGFRIEGLTAGSLTGATASVSPAPAAGPVYLDAQGKPVPGLTATTSSGGVVFGNLSPGVYSVTAVAAGKTCTATLNGGVIAGDWPPTGPETVRVEIAADAVTDDIKVVCF